MSEADPAKAFDDLRAEVSVLRRAVEALPEAWRENRPPDYSPDLGRVIKGLHQVGQHLAAIEENPVLKMTPESYRRGVEQAGLAASREMAGVFQKAIGEVQAERKRLAGIIGQARDRREQRRWLVGVGVSALLFGLAVAPPVFREMTWLHFSQRVASFIVGGRDRWDSGATMMAEAQPESWEYLMWKNRLIEDNQPKIRDCRIEASQKKTPKICVITVKPDSG